MAEQGGNTNDTCILTINGGSSSIKFALFRESDMLTLEREIYGKVDHIGLKGTNLAFKDEVRDQQATLPFEASDHRSAAHFLIDWVEEQVGFSCIRAVGHRVVHGMQHAEPEPVTKELLEELHRTAPYDPDHLPREIELIEAFRRLHPKLLQVACFDTAFHRTLPRVARLMPIPRRFDAMGVQRYGFHGLSYAYLIEELGRVAGAEAVRGRVILAHLGNGASMAAVLGGKSLDTSMGFTPTAGLPMGTRTGDLDPGVAWFLARTEKLTPKQFNDLINHESGLLGISETTYDMADLIERQAKDVRAAEAVEFFCYQARKWIGAFAAVLGGLDTLVFAGGIGENAEEVRARICNGLGFLGIELDAGQNGANALVISTESSKVAVRVIRTDEELMIARSVYRILRNQH